jgi:hypothetical protein
MHVVGTPSIMDLCIICIIRWDFGRQGCVLPNPMQYEIYALWGYALWDSLLYCACALILHWCALMRMMCMKIERCFTCPVWPFIAFLGKPCHGSQCSVRLSYETVWPVLNDSFCQLRSEWRLVHRSSMPTKLIPSFARSACALITISERSD